MHWQTLGLKNIDNGRAAPRVPQRFKDKMMKRKDIENGLALLGALVVLIGVSSAATSAFAAEPEAMAVQETADVTVRAARIANKRSAAVAARSIARENLISLDIEFEDRISTLVAGTR